MNAIEWTVRALTARPRPPDPQAMRGQGKRRVWSIKAAGMACAALRRAGMPLSTHQVAQREGWTMAQAEYRVRSALEHDMIEVEHRPTTRAGRTTYRLAEDVA